MQIYKRIQGMGTKRFLTGIIGIMWAFSAQCATTPFSQYGNIQPVYNYSSNPFWSPGSAYNLRMPIAVYATGPSIETETCQKLMAQLVEFYCGQLNNCATARLSDIRPAIMVYLSRLPDGDYATSCGGYLDSAFAEYKETRTQSIPTTVRPFPTAVMPNPDVLPDDISRSATNTARVARSATNATNAATDTRGANKSAANTARAGASWATGVSDRRAELAALRAETARPNSGDIAVASFPKTVSDASFQDRIESKSAGYKPYQGVSAYTPIELGTMDDYKNTLKKQAANRAAAQQNCDTENFGVAREIVRSDIDKLRTCLSKKTRYEECLDTLDGKSAYRGNYDISNQNK